MFHLNLFSIARKTTAIATNPTTIYLSSHTHTHKMSGYRDDRPQDHQKEGNGRLEEMAKDGTTMPDDPLTHRVIKSVPNPSQEEPYQTSGADLAGAADNATDIPRSNADRAAASGEVVTGTSLPKLLIEVAN